MTRKETNDKLFQMVRATLTDEMIASIPIRRILSRFGSSPSQLEVIDEIINQALSEGVKKKDIKKLEYLVEKLQFIQFAMGVQ